MIATNDLTLALSDAQRAELAAKPGSVHVRDTESQQDYAIVDLDWLRNAHRALHEQEDREAIKEGLRDVEAGRTYSLEEVERRMQDRFGIERK